MTCSTCTRCLRLPDENLAYSSSNYGKSLRQVHQVFGRFIALHLRNLKQQSHKLNLKHYRLCSSNREGTDGYKIRTRELQTGCSTNSLQDIASGHRVFRR